MTDASDGGQYPVEGWHADVDWVTQVYSDGNEAERALWRAETWIEGERSRGNKIVGWGLAGFTGYCSAGIAFGRKGRAVVVQASSAKAGEHFGTLSALGGRTSRLDLALTALVPGGRYAPSVDAYRGTIAQSGRGRRTSAKTLISTTAGGSTCYVGAATSEHRMRIYDKGAEDGSAPPTTKWRWEIQLRRKRAQSYAPVVAAAPSRESVVASAVLTYIRNLGLQLPAIRSSGLFAPAVDTNTDASNTLEWLRAGVAPSVERLLSIYPRDTILAVLGLAEPAAISQDKTHSTEPKNGGR